MRAILDQNNNNFLNKNIMKKIAFIALAIVAALSVSCKKDTKGNDPIDFEEEYTECYALGASANNKWDSMDPMPMNKVAKNTFEVEVDMIKSNENKLIKFCLTSGKDWSQTDYLVPTAVEEGKAYCFLKEGENKLQHTSEKLDGVGNLKDWFFGLEAGHSGHYKITVNPSTLTVTAAKLSSLPDKEEAPQIEWQEGMVYMIGDATPSGWTIENPTAMTKVSDTVFTYEGALAAGELKFPVEFRWDGPFYYASAAGVEISAGNSYQVVFFETNEGVDDNKFKITEAGNYKLTLDIQALTLKVE